MQLGGAQDGTPQTPPSYGRASRVRTW